MTTFRSFVDALEALTITGVTKTFTKGPPKSLNAASLPAHWVQLPRGEEGATVFGEFRGAFPTFIADVVIAVNAVGLGEGPYNNFDDTVDMMDNLAAALGGVLACDVITKSKHSWVIRQTVVIVAGNEYWAVVATVTGNG